MIKKYHVSKNLFDGTLVTGYFYNTDFDVTATDNPIFKSLKVYLPAGIYTLKWSVPVRAVREVNNGVLTQNPFDNSDTWVFQVNSDGYFGISFRNMSSTQWDNSVTIMLNTGNIALPYEPYGDSFKDWFYREYGTKTETFTTLPHEVIGDGQSNLTWSMDGNMQVNGTPTPQNPITPQETGEKTANLCNGVFVQGGINADTGEVGTNSKRVYQFYDVTAGETYSFSSTQYIRTVFGYSGTTPVQNIRNYYAIQPQIDTFTIPSGVNRIGICLMNSGGTNITPSDVSQAMLNVGQPMTYEPFGYKIPILSNGNTYPIYLSDPIRKISTYVDECPSTGTASRIVKKLVLTGNETITNVTTIAGGYRFRVTINANDLNQNTRDDAICSHFVNQEDWSNLGFTLSLNGVEAFFMIAEISTITDFSNWLTSQYQNGTPITLWYVSNTATTETFTAPSIPTSGTAQTFDVDTTLKPSEVSLTYHGWHDHTDTKYTSG